MRRHILSVLLLVSISFALNANTLKNGFVYDDRSAVVHNSFIKDIHNLPKLFQKDYFTITSELSYRPVVTFTYFLDYAFYGPHPWGYHLTNILLHTINCILLYMFLNFIFQSSDGDNNRFTISSLLANRPLFISLLFITHPVLTETINAISFREDLLVFLFYIATLCLYLTIKESTSTIFTQIKSFGLTPIVYLLSCLTYLLALFSKEMAVTIPLAIYIYEWIYAKKKNRTLAILLNYYNIGYIAITVVYLYMRFFLFYNPAEGDVSDWSLTERLLTSPWIILFYLKLLFFPISLTTDYEILPVNSYLSSSFFVPAAALISFLVAALLIRNRNKEIAVGIFFFITLLIPVYNIIPIGRPVAERYLYLPSVGFTIFAGALICSTLQTSLRKNYHTHIFISFLILLCTNSLAAAKRNEIWNNDHSLFTDTIKKMPNSYRSHNNLGITYLEQDKPGDAILHFQAAVSIRPDVSHYHNNLAFAYFKKGLLDEAITHYKKALLIDPKKARYHNSLANVYFKQGRLDDAISEYAVALSLSSD